MSKWQPIETAPQNSREVLVWTGYVYYLATRSDGVWLCAIDGTEMAGQPTHWMPLPAPPLACETGKETT